MASLMTLPIPPRSGPDSGPTFEEICSKNFVIFCQINDWPWVFHSSWSEKIRFWQSSRPVMFGVCCCFPISLLKFWKNVTELIVTGGFVYSQFQRLVNYEILELFFQWKVWFSDNVDLMLFVLGRLDFTIQVVQAVPFTVRVPTYFSCLPFSWLIGLIILRSFSFFH